MPPVALQLGGARRAVPSVAVAEELAPRTKQAWPADRVTAGARREQQDGVADERTFSFYTNATQYQNQPGNPATGANVSNESAPPSCLFASSHGIAGSGC